MIAPEVVDALLEAGCSREQLAAAVKAACKAVADAEDARKEKARNKKRAQRQAEKDATVLSCPDVSPGQSGTTGDSGGQSGTAGDNRGHGFSLSPVPLLSPIPPNNPLTPKPSSKNNQRGSRLPADWTMSGPDLAYALSKNLSEAEAVSLFERFCSWAWSASGPNAVKVNWHQAWQGWVQREAGKGGGGPRAGPPAGKGGFTSVLMDKHMERQNGTRDHDQEYSEH